jgi:hypothetical protein
MKAEGGTVNAKNTQNLLISGIVAGPLFVAVVLVQAVVRQGFDLARLPLSLLSLGDFGWIQRINFSASGLLALACALAMRRPHSGVRGSLVSVLIAVYGVGLIAAGVFPPDPALGFPPGTAQGVPATQSLHSQLHGCAFDIAFLSLITACFVFARRFVAQRSWGWAAYCVATGLITPALIVLGFANAPIMGMHFFGAGVVAMGWLALVSARLRSN